MDTEHDRGGSQTQAVPAHHFISYSTAEAKEFAIRLADALQAGRPPYRVWLDTREAVRVANDA